MFLLVYQCCLLPRFIFLFCFSSISLSCLLIIPNIIAFVTYVSYGSSSNSVWVKPNSFLYVYSFNLVIAHSSSFVYPPLSLLINIKSFSLPSTIIFVILSNAVTCSLLGFQTKNAPSPIIQTLAVLINLPLLALSFYLLHLCLFPL